MNAKTETLSDLEKLLAEASENLKNRQKQTSVARNAETDAVNNLNGIQKRVEAKIAELREKAPSNSNWHNAAIRKYREPMTVTSGENIAQNHRGTQ